MLDRVMTTEFDGNSIMQWLIFICLVIISVIMAKIIYKMTVKFLTKITTKTKNEIDDSLVIVMEGPLEFALIIAGFWYSLKALAISPDIEQEVVNAFQAMIIVDTAWLLSRLVDMLFKKYLEPIAARGDTMVDTQLLGMFDTIVKILIWIAAIFLVFKLEEHTIVSFIAGMGIGGISLALSSKSIKSLFKGLSIFTAKPIAVGEFIKVDGYEGRIEKIDIKRVYLRLYTGRLILLPIQNIVGNPIEKISSETSQRMTIDVGLSYNSSEAQVERAIEILQEIASDNDALENDTIVFPNAFNRFALNIQLTYKIKNGEDILKNRVKTNLEIYKRFKEENLELA